MKPLLALVVLLAVGCSTAPADIHAVEEVLEDVGYYYACGNEVLDLPDGRRFYPLAEQADVDADEYDPAASARGLPLLAVVLAVPEPDEGDDIGTLTVFEDGLARFESRNGTVAWLTEDPVTYEFVC